MLFVIEQHLSGVTPRRNAGYPQLNGAAAGNEVPDHDDNGDDQQQVDEAAADVDNERAQYPQDEKNDGYGQEHRTASRW
jgi:hypothetical protein